jgi:hypothetical protein
MLSGFRQPILNAPLQRPSLDRAAQLGMIGLRSRVALHASLLMDMSNKIGHASDFPARCYEPSATLLLIGARAWAVILTGAFVFFISFSSL